MNSHVTVTQSVVLPLPPLHLLCPFACTAFEAYLDIIPLHKAFGIEF